MAAGTQPFLQVRLFQGVAGWNPKYVQLGSLRRFSLSLRLKSAGVAPLPPCSRKLPDETVKIFAVFPSWLHLLDGEDKNMLFRTIKHERPSLQQLQSGVICQVLSTGAFTCCLERRCLAEGSELKETLKVAAHDWKLKSPSRRMGEHS